MSENAYGIIGLMVAIPVYFLPTGIAFSRQIKEKRAILLLNLFFGWTGLGWVIALLWALLARW